jgi:toxin FitB
VRALLDSCVLTELGKDNGNPTVKSAVADIATANLYLSVLTVGEIAKGIALLRAGRKKTSLGTWLTRVENQYADRILGIDAETARLWGELTARAQRSGIIIPSVDGLLAATALRHGLHVMTRNTKHFEASGALIIDPWQCT